MTLAILFLCDLIKSTPIRKIMSGRSSSPAAAGAGTRRSTRLASSRNTTVKSSTKNKRVSVKKSKFNLAKVDLEDMESDRYYVARAHNKDGDIYMVGKFMGVYEPSKGNIAAPSAKPYVVMSDIHNIKVEGAGGWPFYIPDFKHGVFRTASYEMITSKRRDHEIYLPTAKWTFHANTFFSDKDIMELIPAMSKMPAEVQKTILNMSNPY